MLIYTNSESAIEKLWPLLKSLAEDLARQQLQSRKNILFRLPQPQRNIVMRCLKSCSKTQLHGWRNRVLLWPQVKRTLRFLVMC